MLRKLSTVFSSPSTSTTSARPPSPNLARSAAAVLVEGLSEKAPASTAAMLPRDACTESADRSALRRSLRLTFTV
jgi:hypothetical protein